MIQGLIQPDSGSFKVGETVKLAVVDQDRDILGDGSSTVFEAITGGQDYLTLGNVEVPSRAYCSWFGFKVIFFIYV
jgi:energy-dependent translational throttle protein EttA